MRTSRTISCSFIALFCGCRAGPDYQPPEIEAPAGFVAAAGSEQSIVTDHWWSAFGDPVLESCIETSFAANLDAQVSLQRIRAARALRSMDSGAYWPQIGASLSHTTDRLSANNPRFEQAIDSGLFPRDVAYWDVGFDVSWEIDVFGGNQRRVEGSAARLQEQECERGALLLSVAAEVARNYFELLGNQQRLRMIEQQIANEDARIAILEQKQRSGLIAANRSLERHAIKQQLQALLPPLEAEVRAGTFRLAVLMGRRPEDPVPELDLERQLPSPIGQVPVGLPSELLRRRPDVLAAERRLAAATADIGVASADCFPRFFLTGAPYLESADFTDLFNSASTGWKLGPSVSWNLFAGGANAARVESARAMEQAALLEYQATVNRVLEEVESSLVRYGNDAQSFRYLVQATDSQRRSTDIQIQRQQGGVIEKLEVLDSHSLWLDTNLRRLDQEVLVLTRLVTLYKALGGGWAEAEAIAHAAAEQAAAEQAAAEQGQGT